MKYDTISFGSATLDVFVKSAELKLLKTSRVYTGEALIAPYGAKCEVDQLVMASGGGGTNTAVGFARLGLKAGVVARCGWDFAGKMVRAEIKKEGVHDALLAQIEGEQTDYSTILIGPDGGRTILVYRGGTRLSQSVIDFKKLNAFWFYASSLEGNLGLLKSLLAHAKKNHIKMAANPGRRELGQAKELLALAKDLDLMIVNREEAAKLLNTNLANEKIFPRLARLLPQTMVVVTEGVKGARINLPGQGWLKIEGLKVKMADSTGAGDGFGCGLVAGLAKGWEIKKALKLGVSNGAAAVTRVGAKAGLIKEKEIDLWLEKRLKIRKVR